jgi:uncharacterized protein (TIGR02246 family)
MTNRFVRTLSATTLAFLCAVPLARADAAADVKAVMERFVRAWETSDIKAMDAIMARDKDSVWFGTDAAEHFVGYEPLRASLAKQLATYRGTQVTVKERSIKVSASGTVAWVTEVLDMTTNAGGEAVSVSGMRLTSVLEKRQGTWLMVHFHSSLPVAGQAVKY